MNITELGKYRTRGGGVVVVHEIWSDHFMYPVRCMYNNVEHSATRDGKYFTGTTDSMDLVEKIEPPVATPSACCIEAQHKEVEARLHECQESIRQALTCSVNTTCFGLVDLKPEPKFKITETGWYKTRDGRLVEVTDVGCDINYPIYGLVENDRDGFGRSWEWDGVYWPSRSSEYAHWDLVEKVEAPAKPRCLEWIDKAFDVPTPDDVDTIVKGAVITIDDANALIFETTHCIDCKIEVRNYTDLTAFFEDSVFEGCSFICNTALIEHGFLDCKFIGAVTFLVDDGDCAIISERITIKTGR